MRRFNTEGPVRSFKHYAIPPLARVDVGEILDMIRDERYFVLHAPRQTGKTSALIALRDLLNGGEAGDFRCVHVNVEAAQAMREDVEGAMRVIVGELASRARSLSDEFLYNVWPDILTTFGAGALKEALTSWCMADPKPLVLLIEVVPREPGYVLQDSLDQDLAWYVDAAGGLDVDKLLGAFQSFFRAHSEHWLERFEYREAGPQLILQAFLQRVVNSGGRIEREYGLGRGRTDLLILWPSGEGGPPELWSKCVVECKVWHEGQRQSLDGTIGKGLEQTLRYMDRCGSEAGHLVVFDRAQGKQWEEKVCRREVCRDGRTIVVWGM